MNTKKILIGAIVGGIVYFLLGYLFYGKLLTDFFAKNAGSATGVNRAMDQFVWWSLIVGNLFMGLLLSYVFVKSNVRSVSAGLTTGFVVGLFSSASYDFVAYATSNLMNTTGLLGDVATFAVMSAIAGAVIAWVGGMIGKPTATK